MMTRITLKQDPKLELPTQYGFISVKDWLKKEKERIERKAYPWEKDYQPRKAEVRRVGKDLALFVDEVE